MKSLLYISPDSSGSENVPPDPNEPKRALLSQGFIAAAFGAALGLALTVVSEGIRRLRAPAILATWLDGFSFWEPFLLAFILGTVTAGIYNLLVAHHINLFGLESRMD